MRERLKKVSENVYEIEKHGDMKVPGRIFMSDKLMERVEETSLKQVANVACLPGIVKCSIAMPDMHSGYGFPIGGVAAFDAEKGIVSPGGVGYDINCGVRLLASDLTKDEFMKKRREITRRMAEDVPAGTGRGTEEKLSDSDLDEIMKKGVGWAIEKGMGEKEDAEKVEDGGCIAGADPKKVSQKARARGRNQLGTLGAGNHFIDVQEVGEIYDGETAEIFGLKKGRMAVMIHTGSRGLGHQTASDYVKIIEKEFPEKMRELPDRELACAPLNSETGRNYMAAMAAAANFAFANRHAIMHKVRLTFERFFPESELKLVYDVAHNVAKIEPFESEDGGGERKLCVHRKGATRSFGRGRKEICEAYRETGQPVFIPGSMGTPSYVLVGTEEAREKSFASTAHGSGRAMSRTEAKKKFSREEVESALKKMDVYVEGQSARGLLEENPRAYKSSEEVVKTSHELGIGRLVAELKPVSVIIG